MLHVARALFFDFAWFLLGYTIFVNATYLLYTFVAVFALCRHLRTRNRERIQQLFRSRLVPGISVILPAYNESLTIVDSVRAMMRLLYSQYEIIVVNDGSTDDTLALMIEAFHLERVEKTYDEDIATQQVRGIYCSYEYPRLIVIDKMNGGKADAANAGINAAKHPLYCACDADSVLEEDALLQLVLPVMDRLTFVPVAGGVVRAANGSRITRGTMEHVGLARRPIEIFQVVEYLRAFLIGRTAQSALNITLIVSGAFGLFDTETVKRVGGYNKDAIGEDFELIVRITAYLRDIKRKFEIVFVPHTVCWTMIPHQWKSLGNQRNRWQRGLVQTLHWHMRMFLNPRYGRTGFVGMAYFVFIELLGTFAELFGYAIFPLGFFIHALNLPIALLFFLVSICGGMFLSLSALLLEELSFHRYEKWSEVATLALYAIVENLGYRQLTLWWRCRGILDYVSGTERGWGEMERAAFASPSEPDAA
jgi:cellulose synthase/poly-beta-1,6-N-acetylglucosamine synthase-like glycosyltransferase